MTTSRPTVLVAGNGMVGFRFCRELVARAADRYRLVVYGEEERPALPETPRALPDIPELEPVAVALDDRQLGLF